LADFVRLGVALPDALPALFDWDIEKMELN
jgi:hypothetical protein